jgi:hypothetical protein
MGVCKAIVVFVANFLFLRSVYLPEAKLSRRKRSRGGKVLKACRNGGLTVGKAEQRGTSRNLEASRREAWFIVVSVCYVCPCVAAGRKRYGST